MRKRVTALMLGILLLVGQPGSVFAASANAEPETQTHNYGVPSTWTLSWGGDAPFDADFHYGDGWVHIWRDVFIVGANDSHTYWPCYTTVFTQRLRVWDSDSGYGQDYTRATEKGGGPPC